MQEPAILLFSYTCLPHSHLYHYKQLNVSYIQSFTLKFTAATTFPNIMSRCANHQIKSNQMWILWLSSTDCTRCMFYGAPRASSIAFGNSASAALLQSAVKGISPQSSLTIWFCSCPSSMLSFAGIS